MGVTFRVNGTKMSRQSGAEKYPHLYGHRWRKLRKTFLAENPLCVMCIDEDRVAPATELDHIKKHNGNPELFWDIKNLQGLCAFHHRSVKSQMERTGKIRGNKSDGTPLDPNHIWNRG